MTLDISFRQDMAVISEEEISLVMSVIEEILDEMSKLEKGHPAAISPNRKCRIQCPE
jgi:signal recognition particle GTPase